MERSDAALNKVRTSCRAVWPSLQHLVALDEQRLTALAEQWLSQQTQIPPWPIDLHLPGADDRQLTAYLLVLDALNFCFWSRNGKWQVSYAGKTSGGYFGLCLALRRFFERHGQDTLSVLAQLDEAGCAELLSGSGELALLAQRRQFARELATLLLDRYQGDARQFVRKAKGSALALVELICEELPGFEDLADYEGQTVYVRKRAQILAADLWGAFAGAGVGAFDDIDQLTAFADYKVPQILWHKGALVPCPSLAQQIKAGELLPAGSPEELALRVATILAAERLSELLAGAGHKSTAVEVDWLLWNQSKTLDLAVPHHLTLTTSY